MTPLDQGALVVLRQYPVASGGAVVPVHHHSGFSGAQLWRVARHAKAYCLRAWPRSGPASERLQKIHDLMDRAHRAGLEFVPAVFRNAAGQTWTEHMGRLWELTAWMPGTASFHDQPGERRLEAACTALARLHLAWSQVSAGTGPCPAVQRRLDSAREWTALVKSGWRPVFAADGQPVHPWARRAWQVLQTHFTRLSASLATWAEVRLPLQPCLCDIWHAHVLFEGDAVTGLVDYGSVKVDHVAADLARLLGSLVPDNGERIAAGLAAYARLRPLAPQELLLVDVLDRTGTLLGAAHWLRWLYHEHRWFEDRSAVARRLAELVTRIERWEQ